MSAKRDMAAVRAEVYLCHCASKYSQALDRVALDVRVKADSGAMRAHDNALCRLRDAAYSLVRAETALERTIDGVRP